VRRFVALLALSLAVSQAQGLELRDDLGHVTRFDAPPQRIVSLLPSLTETVCALDACTRLVGVDRYSNHPATVRALPQVGGLDDTNVELITALKPDVVLVATSTRVTERLRGLGLKVVALEPRSFKDLHRVLGLLGPLLGADGETLWRHIDAGVGAAAQSVPAKARGLKVYYEVASGIYAAGETSFMGETLAKLGVANIIPAALGPFPKINPEFVVRADPALIMIAQREVAGLAQRPGWAGIQALREGRVCGFTPEQGDVLARPGPRMAEAAQIMAQCLRDKAPR
jgi:iron complex transport system substrate-binding protein